MKKRRINLRLPHLKVRHLPIRFISLILILIIFVFLLIISLRALIRSDYFQIKDILVAEGIKDDFSYFKGRNIFSVDLRKESKYISDLYPLYKKIRLIRLLPNRIYVDFIKRQGLAYLKLYRDFCVDKDLILFDLPSNLEKEDLPVIIGLETKIHGPRTGKKYAIRELTLAINIIKEINNNKGLKNYKLKVVDLGKSAFISLLFADGLEVKLGQGGFKNKINLLSSILIKSANTLNNIKYIDLRFKDPLIKLKDTK